MLGTRRRRQSSAAHEGRRYGALAGKPPVAPGGWHRRAGVTLVEILVTIVLSALMVTGAATVVVQSARARGEAESAVAKRWAHWALLHRFREDVDGRLRGLPDDVPVVVFATDAEELFHVIALASMPDPAGLLGARMAARITYLRRPSVRQEGQTLIRRVTPLVKDGFEESEEVLADGLYDLTVEGFREGKWREPQAQAPDAGRKAAPLGLRLGFRMDSAGSTKQVCAIYLGDGFMQERTKQPKPSGAGK